MGKVATSIKFFPLGDKLLIKPDKEETKTDSGLYIAEIAQEKPQQGKVMAVGAGKYEKGVLLPMYCKIGDVVAYGKYAGSPIKIEGEEFVILKEEEVFGIVK